MLSRLSMLSHLAGFKKRLFLKCAGVEGGYIDFPSQSRAEGVRHVRVCEDVAPTGLLYPLLQGNPLNRSFILFEMGSIIATSQDDCLGQIREHA